MSAAVKKQQKKWKKKISNLNDKQYNKESVALTVIHDYVVDSLL
jgi:hypothetical protein